MPEHKTRHRVTITPNAHGLGIHQLLVDDHDISRGVRSLTMSLNPDEIPGVELELGIVEINRMDTEQAELYISDSVQEALITLGWTPPRRPKVGVNKFGAWEIEAHTWSRVSDDGCYDIEEPTGQLTFRCDCGHRIHDRNTAVLTQARTHLAEQHPDWEQIPDDVAADTSATPSADANDGQARS